jgi:hypothetical protein
LTKPEAQTAKEQSERVIQLESQNEPQEKPAEAAVA